jgi:hypothetical protein
MPRGLVLVKFECDVSLAFAAAEHVLLKLLPGRGVCPIPTDHFRSLL